MNDVAHHAERQRRDRPPAEMAEHHHGHTQHGDATERQPCRTGIAVTDGTDHPAGIERHEHLGQGRQQHRRDAGGGEQRRPAPQEEGEGQYLAQYGGAWKQVFVVIGHGEFTAP